MRGASLVEASNHLHVEVLTALLHKLERMRLDSFTSTLREVVRQGRMEVFTALVTHVSSDVGVVHVCLSVAADTALERGQVCCGAHSLQCLMYTRSKVRLMIQIEVLWLLICDAQMLEAILRYGSEEQSMGSVYCTARRGSQVRVSTGG